MTQILSKQGLIFEIISARINEEDPEKRHVVYVLQIKYIHGFDDIRPSVIERRYTDFLKLYTSLGTIKPAVMTNVDFPRKVLMGNFNNDLITARSTGFESLLKLISADSQLRSSNALYVFLSENELAQARRLLSKKDYALALPILENIYLLLSKVFTDRSPPVIFAISRVVGCSLVVPGNSETSSKWADIALHRFEGVSDSDLLELYVPFLNSCMPLFKENRNDIEVIQKRLSDLTNLKVKEKYKLLEAIDDIEKRLFDKGG